MTRPLVVICAGCLAAAAVIYFSVHDRAGTLVDRIADLQHIATSQHESLLGYTKYRDYVSASRQSLSGQTKFVAAAVSRHYTITRGVERSLLGAKSNGAVVVSYTADYAFGYDVAPGSYDIVDTPAGLEIRIARPTLVATPAIRALSHEVLASGLLTDENLAMLKLYEDATRLAAAEGQRLQSDEAIVALCEKRLTAFVRDFLAKQPGVQHVPAITVSYATLPMQTRVP